MTPGKQQEQTGKTPSNDREVDHGTRSGRPNPEDVPSHSKEHKSGYGGEQGQPRTSTDQRETQKGR
ncbi:MAG TPA: hypothetical protein VJS39_00790 [Gemmatimonadaceae bacterium]|nr:hypothetical protein [Gemmatimonadaceae bacterium]